MIDKIALLCVFSDADIHRPSTRTRRDRTTTELPIPLDF